MATTKPIIDDGSEARLAIIEASRALARAHKLIESTHPDVAKKLADAGFLVGSAIRDLIAGTRSSS